MSSRSSTPEDVSRVQEEVAGSSRGRARVRGGRRASSRGRSGSRRGGVRTRGGSRSSRSRSRLEGNPDAERALSIVQTRTDRMRGLIAGMGEERMRELLLEMVEVHPSLLFNIMEPVARQPGGYHPADGSSQDWCVCGKCREMPTDREKVCCESEDCISLQPQFQVYILDPGVLSLARLFRQDVLVFDDGAEDVMRANRHAAYRQYVLWSCGRLGAGNRVVVPSCCVWGIRDKYPDPFQSYTGFEPTRLA